MGIGSFSVWKHSALLGLLALLAGCSSPAQSLLNSEIYSTVRSYDQVDFSAFAALDPDQFALLSASSSTKAEHSNAVFIPDETFELCYPKIGNAPPTFEERMIKDYNPFVLAEGRIALAVKPVNGACLSSSFGPRQDRIHKGLDIAARPARMIHAPADGVVIEAEYRYDYGNYVLIDHGFGIYTRLAHLAYFNDTVAIGAHLSFGDPIGLMGNTSDRPIGLHVHYEVLVGNYNTPEKSFGLIPKNIFDYPGVDPSPTPPKTHTIAALH